jgi:hypothetical protein
MWKPLQLGFRWLWNPLTSSNEAVSIQDAPARKKEWTQQRAERDARENATPEQAAEFALLDAEAARVAALTPLQRQREAEVIKQRDELAALQQGVAKNFAWMYARRFRENSSEATGEIGDRATAMQVLTQMHLAAQKGKPQELADLTALCSLIPTQNELPAGGFLSAGPTKPGR